MHTVQYYVDSFDGLGSAVDQYEESFDSLAEAVAFYEEIVSETSGEGLAFDDETPTWWSLVHASIHFVEGETVPEPEPVPAGNRW